MLGSAPRCGVCSIPRHGLGTESSESCEPFPRNAVTGALKSVFYSVTRVNLDAFLEHHTLTD